MKSIVLLFDGTWNTEAKAGEVTNVHRLKDAFIAGTASDPPSGMSAPRIFYDQGVGTGGPIDRIVGGVFGWGLTENVRQGYRYLSQYYRPGRPGRPGEEASEDDQILVFGFSRGAFTARSLAGFVAASGLLREACCDHENLAFAWRFYRTPPEKRMPADKARLEALCYPDVKIRLLGVFDTVGSLGVPTGRLRNFAGSRDRFHDTKVGSAIEIALHAVALDEHRGPFVPALFARPDNLAPRPIEQVWFPGVHSDIGGGYGAGAQGGDAISDLALEWMIARVRALVPNLPVPAVQLKKTGIDDPHDSLGLFVVDRLRPVYRLIDGRPMTKPEAGPAGERTVPPPSGRWTSYRLQPPIVSWREKIHRSVFDLIATTHLDAGRRKYLPPQLQPVAEALRQDRLKVVDHGGTDMDPADVVTLLDGVENAVGKKFLR